MIVVSNGYIIKEFEFLQDVLDYFGYEEGGAILAGKHSQYSFSVE